MGVCGPAPSEDPTLATQYSNNNNNNCCAVYTVFAFRTSPRRENERVLWAAKNVPLATHSDRANTANTGGRQGRAWK